MTKNRFTDQKRHDSVAHALAQPDLDRMIACNKPMLMCRNRRSAA
jgi:hypothetical protein